MTTAEQEYINGLLDPGRTFPPLRRQPGYRPVVEIIELTEAQKAHLWYDKMTDDERMAWQDEQLEKMGVPINPKQRI